MVSLPLKIWLSEKLQYGGVTTQEMQWKILIRSIADVSEPDVDKPSLVTDCI